MNEIILTSENTITNKTLKTATVKACTLLNGGITAEKAVAKLVHEVNEKGLAQKAGFANTAEWAAQYLRFDKSKTSRYIKIVKEFYDYIREDGAKAWDIFSATQLVEMLKADSIEALEKISPEMTCKEIRETLKRNSEMIDVAGKESAVPNEQSDTESENTEETTDKEPEVEKEIATFKEVRITDDLTEALATVKHYAQKHNNVLLVNLGIVYKILIEVNII